MDPVTGAIIGAGSLLSGFASIGESPQEKATREAMERLKGSYEWLKETPFSKSEIMNYLVPKLQKMYRGATDVVAGRAASVIGESDAANFSELYTQTLGNVIGQGEMNAAGIEADLAKWFGQLDDAAKSRFIQAMSLELQGAQNMPQMNDFQKFLTSAISGAQISSNIVGNINIADSIGKQTSATEKLVAGMYSYTGDSALKMATAGFDSGIFEPKKESKKTTFKGASKISD